MRPVLLKSKCLTWLWLIKLLQRHLRIG